MLVNKTNIAEIYRNLKATFNKALNNTEAQWDKVAMKVTSKTKAMDYAWLGNFPQLREWIGDKVVKSLEAFDYSLKNKDFETTIAVKRNDIEDDTIGIYGPQAQSAGESAKQWPDQLVFALLNNAFAGLCYDGKPFFSDAHPVGGKSTKSNKGTKVFDISTVAKAKASYGAARTALRTMKNEHGVPLNINPNLLVVPPALEDDARTLMTADRLEDGKPNLYKGTATVLVCPYLTSDKAWFLMDTTKAMKPFIFQERKAPVLVSQTDMDNDRVFMRGEYLYGAEARGNAGFGLWQLAFGSTGTTA